MLSPRVLAACSLAVTLAAAVVAPPATADDANHAPVVDRVRELFPPTRGWFRLVADARYVVDEEARLVPDLDVLRHPRIRRADNAGHSLAPRFPARAGEPLRIANTAASDELWIELSAVDAAPTAARIEDGLVVYPDAYPVTDVMFKATPTHVDEYLLLRSAAAPTRWRYTVRRGPGIAALRQAGNSIEAVDGRGRPYLRAGRPLAIDVTGRRMEGSIVVVDDALVVAVDVRGLTPPILIDPDWRSTGDMAYGRFFARVDPLPDGRLLATGGCSAAVCSDDLTLPGCPSVVREAEALDLGSRTWSQVGSAVARFFHASQALDDGRVLIAGGCSVANCATATSSVQTFAAGGGFVDRPALSRARGGLTAARLADGRVLLAGGCDATGCGTVAEIFDAATNQLRTAQAMTGARGRAVAVTLADGRVLVAGGCTTINCQGVLASAELYDPVLDRWTAVGPMAVPRAGHWAALLGDGRVLVGGGCRQRDCASVLRSTEIFTPGADTFAPGPDQVAPRLGAEALTLPDGKVVVSQGCASRDVCDLSNEVYLPATNQFAAIESAVTVRAFHQLVLHRPTQQVVAVGGCQPNTCSWWNETYDVSASFADAGVPPPDGGAMPDAGHPVAGDGGGCCQTGRGAGAAGPTLILVVGLALRRGRRR